MAVLPAGLTVLAQPAAGADPVDWWDVLRHDVIPVASAYLVLLAFLLAHRRDRRAPARVRRRRLAAFRLPSGVPPAASWGDLVRYLVETVAGGYALFLLIVVTYYVVLGGETAEFLRQAVVEGSLLTFGIVLPGLLAISWLHDRRRGRFRDGRETS